MISSRNFILLLCIGLTACQAARPAPAPYRPAPSAARPSPPPTSQAAEGSWSFGIAGSRCRARITHPDITLAITAGPERRATLSVSSSARRLPARRSVRLAFAGEGGSWDLQGRSAARGNASFAMPLDDAGESRIQSLLSGGTLSISGSGVSVPALKLPDAGVSGRDWYGCVAGLGQDQQGQS